MSLEKCEKFSMGSKAFTKFTESIEKDAPIVVVEDSANALGRSLSVGAMISNRLTINGPSKIKTLCSEVPFRVQEKMQGSITNRIESVPDLMKQLESSEEFIFLHSITPILIRSSIHQIVRLFRKLFLMVCQW